MTIVSTENQVDTSMDTDSDNALPTHIAAKRRRKHSAPFKAEDIAGIEESLEQVSPTKSSELPIHKASQVDELLPHNWVAPVNT